MARYPITGIDENGELLQSEIFSTQVFDYNEIECISCGGIFQDRQIIEHVHPTNPGAN